MKKLAVGCLIVVAVLAVLGGVASYWVYRKVATTVSQFAELASVPQLEQQVTNTAAFVPPESGELTAGQVQRLVQVQQAVRARLGARFGELQVKYKALMDKPEATVVDLPQLLNAYRDLAATWMDAKRAHVEALNQAKFSLEEYRWVRGQVYAAVGLPFLDIDVTKLIENIRSGRAGDEPAQMGGAVGPSGPEVNRTLVEPFRESLEQNVVLASFGL